MSMKQHTSGAFNDIISRPGEYKSSLSLSNRVSEEIPVCNLVSELTKPICLLLFSPNFPENVLSDPLLVFLDKSRDLPDCQLVLGLEFRKELQPNEP